MFQKRSLAGNAPRPLRLCLQSEIFRARLIQLVPIRPEKELPIGGAHQDDKEDTEGDPQPERDIGDVGR
jgi:hypothetical protein